MRERAKRKKNKEISTVDSDLTKCCNNGNMNDYIVTKPIYKTMLTKN